MQSSSSSHQNYDIGMGANNIGSTNTTVNSLGLSHSPTSSTSPFSAAQSFGLPLNGPSSQSPHSALKPSPGPSGLSRPSSTRPTALSKRSSSSVGFSSSDSGSLLEPTGFNLSASSVHFMDNSSSASALHRAETQSSSSSVHFSETALGGRDEENLGASNTHDQVKNEEGAKGTQSARNAGGKGKGKAATRNRAGTGSGGKGRKKSKDTTADEEDERPESMEQEGMGHEDFLTGTTATPALSGDEEAALANLRGESRGRKKMEGLPPSRARDIQRAFRARRAAHLATLEDRIMELEKENAELRRVLDLPLVERQALGSGPTGRGKSIKEGGVPMSERVRAKRIRDQLRHEAALKAAAEAKGEVYIPPIRPFAISLEDEKMAHGVISPSASPSELPPEELPPDDEHSRRSRSRSSKESRIRNRGRADSVNSEASDSRSLRQAPTSTSPQVEESHGPAHDPPSIRSQNLGDANDFGLDFDWLKSTDAGGLDFNFQTPTPSASAGPDFNGPPPPGFGGMSAQWPMNGQHGPMSAPSPASNPSQDANSLRQLLLAAFKNGPGGQPNPQILQMMATAALAAQQQQQQQQQQQTPFPQAQHPNNNNNNLLSAMLSRLTDLPRLLQQQQPSPSPGPGFSHHGGLPANLNQHFPNPSGQPDLRNSASQDGGHGPHSLPPYLAQLTNGVVSPNFPDGQPPTRFGLENSMPPGMSFLDHQQPGAGPLMAPPSEMHLSAFGKRKEPPIDSSRAQGARKGGGEAPDLLSRLKHCCHLSDFHVSADPGILLFASRLCLIVQCPYDGDHEGKIEDLNDDGAASQKRWKSADGESHPNDVKALQERWLNVEPAWMLLKSHLEPPEPTDFSDTLSGAAAALAQLEKAAKGQDGQSQIATGRLAAEMIIRAVRAKAGPRTDEWMTCGKRAGLIVRKDLVLGLINGF